MALVIETGSLRHTVRPTDPALLGAALDLKLVRAHRQVAPPLATIRDVRIDVGSNASDGARRDLLD